MKVQSIFGVYADQLQVVINSSLSMFAPTWYQKYFVWSPTQTQLTFVQVIGASRIEAAASIVDRSSGAPLRSRAALAKLQGEIPAIKEKFSMSEQDYRDFLTIQAMTFTSEASKKQQLLDFLFGDVQKAGSAAHKRLDIMALQAISTGKISLTADWNPDGIVLKDDLDLLMPDSNRKQASVKWSDRANSKPIDDITNLVNEARLLGREFDKMLMSPSAFLNLAHSAQVISSLVSFNQLQKGASVATLDKVNEYMTANLFPTIEIVNEVVGIEKDGIIQSVRPFADANVSFVPAGNLGTIKNAFCIEEMRPVGEVSYASFNHALISKWQENDPWSEFTGVELNAFPAVDLIDRIYLMNVEF